MADSFLGWWGRCSAKPRTVGFVSVVSRRRHVVAPWRATSPAVSMDHSEDDGSANEGNAQGDDRRVGGGTAEGGKNPARQQYRCGAADHHCEDGGDTKPSPTEGALPL
jgi:hypothetical protein